MRKAKWALWTCAGALLATSASPVWGVLNNGFDSDYVYVPRSSSGDNRLATIRVHRESDGSEVTRWEQNYWTSLTFSGAGGGGARLFAAQPLNMTDNWHGTDVLIAELDASGNTINSKPLSQLLGGQSPGAFLDLGNIRYNSYHNTLIVSANPDGNNANAPATAWEIDLSLGTLVHTYQGPASGLGRPVNGAFDERTGKFYLGGRNMGNNTDLGNLVAFDTAGRAVGGTTASYSLAMNGPARYSTDAYWYKPVSPVYRAGDPSRYDGTDTLLDLTGANASGGRVYEVYLDTVLHPPAADGLLSTGLSASATPFRSYLGYNGQQDDLTGEVWVANFRLGFSALRNDNTFANFQSGYDWWDIDSPVPEPATLSLLIIGGLGLLVRRRPV